MSLPDSMKDKEIFDILEHWTAFCNDCFMRMSEKVQEDKLGWNDQAFESVKKIRLAEKIAKLMTHDYTYEDCVDAANYIIILGYFAHKRELNEGDINDE